MQKKINRMMPAFLLCFALALSGCAPLIGDHPLEKWTPEMRDRQTRQMAGNRSPELLVFVAFSGGGTRADLYRPEAPNIIINSTDLPDGVRITFTEE